MPNPLQSYIPNEYSCHPPHQYLSYIPISCCFHQLIVVFEPQSYISLTDLSSYRVAITIYPSSLSDGKHLLLFIAFHTSNTRKYPFFPIKRNNCASTYLVAMLASWWIPESDSPFNSGRDSINELNDWSICCLLVVTSKTMNREHQGEKVDQRSKMKSDQSASKLTLSRCWRVDGYQNRILRSILDETVLMSWMLGQFVAFWY